MAAEKNESGEKKKKKGGTRTKLPMELIKNPKQRYVAFSKRKKGLFGKCAALCSLFSGDVEVAALVFSQTGKAFSFGHPSPDGVLRRYLDLQSGDTHNTTATKAATGSDSSEAGFGWVNNTNVDEMNLEELQLFKTSLEELRNRVFVKAIDLEFGGSDIKSGETIHDSEDLFKGLGFESASDNQQDQHYDDLSISDYLRFESISNNQRRQYLGDGGLMDILYEKNIH